MQFHRHLTGRDHLTEGIAGEQQMPVERFEQRRAAFARVGTGQQGLQRMPLHLLPVLQQCPDQAGRRLGHQPHAAIDNGVAVITRMHQRRPGPLGEEPKAGLREGHQRRAFGGGCRGRA
jgi:hypothetical protein